MLELCDLMLVTQGHNVTHWHNLVEKAVKNASSLALDKFLLCTAEFGPEVAGLSFIAHHLNNGTKGNINSNIFLVLSVRYILIFNDSLLSQCFPAFSTIYSANLFPNSMFSYSNFPFYDFMSQNKSKPEPFLKIIYFNSLI